MNPAPVNNGPTPEEIAAQKKLMDDMERESDQLDSRAAAVESTVGTMEQQMHQSGLGMRGDIVESRANLRNDMAKAKQALDTMDTDRARKFLDHGESRTRQAGSLHRPPIAEIGTRLTEVLRDVGRETIMLLARLTNQE